MPKHCLLFIFLCFFAHNARAQNWKTITTNDTTYFMGGKISADTNDKNVLRTIWVDSSNVIGNDTAGFYITSITQNGKTRIQKLYVQH